MLTLAFQCRLSDTGSISAPARKVSSIEPAAGQKGDDVGLGDVFFDARQVPGDRTDHDLDQRDRHRDADAHHRGQQRHSDPDGCLVVDVHHVLLTGQWPGRR